jgi:hypothetical protein
MDVGIGPTEIAQGLLNSERLGLEEKPLMGRSPACGGDGESNLERHVEAGCAPAELDPAEIVEGISACRDELQDPIQTACGPRDLERGSRAEPEAAKARDERQEQGLAALIVGDVQKGVFRRVSLGDRSASACCAPPCCNPSLGAALARARLLLESEGATATAAMAFQVLGHHGPKFPVPLGRDPEYTGRRRRGGVGRRDDRAGSQSHGPLYSARVFRVNVHARIQTGVVDAHHPGYPAVN